MARRIPLFLAWIWLGTAVFAPAVSGQWLHVRVEVPSDAKRVHINLPLSLVEAVVPVIEDDDFNRGKLRLDLDEIKIADLRQIWSTLKQQGDFQIASVQTEEADIRASIEGDYLIVRSAEGLKASVDIQIPVPVVDALLAGQGEELDILGAVRALGASGVGEIVRVEKGDTRVRVWIDQSSKGE